MENDIKAITFDAYGTLLDPMGTTWDAVCEILDRSHADADREAFFGWLMDRIREGCCQPYFRSYLQLYREYLPAACAAFGVPGTPEDADLVFAYHRQRKPYGEVPEVVELLQRRFETGIISNADTRPLRYNLEDAGLHPGFIVTSEMMQAYKPDPALFNEALRRLGLDPEQVAHVGDSPEEDIAPAHALGMRTIWINRNNASYPDGHPSPDYIIETLSGLLNLFG